MDSFPGNETCPTGSRHARSADALCDPGKSAHKELAEKFVALATSPKVQAEGIVKRFNWYPGIDADHVKAELDGDTEQALHRHFAGRAC